MTHLFSGNYQFAPKWGMTLLAVIVAASLAGLGYWQIARAHEKEHTLELEAQRAQKPVVDWQPDSPPPAQYQRIRVQGRFLPTVFLLDNQFYDHAFGYHVFNPLLLENGQLVLVDRGWVKGSLHRNQLPEVTTPRQRSVIAGRVYYPSTKQWVLGDAIEQKKDKYYVIEKIDAKLVSQVLHKSVYPFIIRLNKNAANGYVREWPVVTLSPQRHYGYAVQWFAMALAVLVIYIVLNLKKTHEKN
ncbi:SURF1 family protein [Legionella sp. MW5194]|nr:SURF1 family protein [Legionella sp. MW5194]